MQFPKRKPYPKRRRSKDPDVPFEDVEQEKYFEYIDRLIVPKVRDADQLIYHVPNGGDRNAVVGKALKKQGTRAGVADIHIDIPMFCEDNDLACGYRIELKRVDPRTATISAEQKSYRTKVIERGFLHDYAYGADHAFELTCEYLRIPLMIALDPPRFPRPPKGH